MTYNLFPRFENRGLGVIGYVPRDYPDSHNQFSHPNLATSLIRNSIYTNVPNDIAWSFFKEMGCTMLVSMGTFGSLLAGTFIDVGHGDHSKAVICYIVGSVGTVASTALIVKNCIVPIWCRDKETLNLDSPV